jgi:hypothetical protein
MIIPGVLLQQRSKMMSKHTEGPWSITGVSENDYEYAEIGTENQTIAVTLSPNNDMKDPELAANALLIAAAPELLEALKDVELHWQEVQEACGEDCEVRQQVRAAIAKAEGK